MSEPTKAVFLSYAREDTEAAKRIAEVLRAAGAEVWFDQSELRGGDSWDQKIRTQIKTCALFIPIVSQRTEERSEGYFRREWKLATDRMQDMGSGRTFIVPVAIDQTKEDGADVPEEFRRYHWTRLPEGAATPEFVEQVKRLLEPKKPALTASAKPPMSTLPPFKQSAQAAAAAVAVAAAVAPKSGSRLPLILGAVAALIVAAGVFLWLRHPAAESLPTQRLEAAATAKPAPELRRDKSIAVLPFTNMSEDKDSGYFADGVHEDILTNLALIRELRVVSRTSVMQYRATTKTMKQIAQELGVTYILEGSVRRSGNKVRVTGQLIHAATDEHVWAEAYDRDLTDVFSIQAELSKKIAAELKAALSPEEKANLERRPTSNPVAYDLFLKARQMNRDGNDTREELLAQAAVIQSAVTLDPDFAEAWGYMAAILSQIRFGFIDMSDALLARAKAAIDRAQALAPNDPGVDIAVGTYYYYAHRDYQRALVYFEQATRRFPNAYTGPFLTALAQRRQGHWMESLENLRRAQQFDPGSTEIARNLVISLRAMRRYDEAIIEQARRVRLLPESLRESFALALLHYFARGSTKEVDELLASPLAARAGPDDLLAHRKIWGMVKGDLATADQIDQARPEL
ncbi:MAG: TIR domain-containing protein, partial [bacterium]|nr:TIR domain-containing protein [bacterium]